MNAALRVSVILIRTSLALFEVKRGGGETPLGGGERWVSARSRRLRFVGSSSGDTVNLVAGSSSRAMTAIASGRA